MMIYPIVTSMLRASARVWIRPKVCGCTLSLTKNLSRFPLVSAKDIAMASAAAVASSSSDALAMGMPVRSAT